MVQSSQELLEVCIHLSGLFLLYPVSCAFDDPLEAQVGKAQFEFILRTPREAPNHVIFPDYKSTRNGDFLTVEGSGQFPVTV